MRLGWDFDDTDLAELPKLTQLQEFHIGSTHITPRGEAWLRRQFPVVHRHFPARSAYGNPFEGSPRQQSW